MISRTGLHAIRALAVLGRLPDGKFAGAGEIARDIGGPPNYLGKLLQTLSHEGLVVSQKGMGGGFRLARPALAITLFDVVRLIDHVERWNGCVLGRPDCSDTSPCAMHEKWKSVRVEYLKLLSTTTLQDLIEHPAGLPLAAGVAAVG